MTKAKPMLKALIFDVDGTLADTEMAHLAAFNHAFAEQGLDWHWDVPLYTRLLEVSGGRERIRAYWQSRSDWPQAIEGRAIEATIERIHEIKTAVYEQAVRDGQVPLQPGVLALLSAACDAGLQLAVATTTSPGNVSGLLRHWLGADWRRHFAVIEDAATATRKKPDPQVYLQTLGRLDLTATQVLAVEDSGNGLRAALQAAVPTLITTNTFTEHHDFTGALRVLPDLQGVDLTQLRQWHAEAARTVVRT